MTTERLTDAEIDDVKRTLEGFAGYHYAPDPRVLRLLIDEVRASRSPATPADACTGLTATWCPVHGYCECAKDGEGNPTLDDPQCRLHAPTSKHAEPAETLRAPEMEEIERLVERLRERIVTLNCEAADERVWRENQAAAAEQNAYERAAALVRQEAEREKRQGKATKARRLLAIANQIRALAAAAPSPEAPPDGLQERVEAAIEAYKDDPRSCAHGTCPCCEAAFGLVAALRAALASRSPAPSAWAGGREPFGVKPGTSLPGGADTASAPVHHPPPPPGEKP